MNNKRMVVSMVVLMAIMVAWNPMWQWLARKYNWKMGPDAPTAQTTPPAATASTEASTSQAATTTPATTTPTTGTSAAVSSAVTPVSATPSNMTIGWLGYDPKGDKSPFPIGVKLTSRGAAVEAVELNRYKREVSVDESYVFQTPYATKSEYADPLATRSISINGGAPVALWNLNWKLNEPTTQGTDAAKTAVYTTTVSDGAGHQVAINKTYAITPVKPEDSAAGYEMKVGYTLSNLSDTPLKVKIAYNGPTVPLAENTRDIPNVVMGFDANGGIAFTFEGAASLKANPLDLKIQKAYPALWFGFSSNYFDAIVRPVDLAGNPLGFGEAKAFSLQPEAKELAKREAVIALETPELSVPANGNSGFTLNVFVGPKLRAILNNPVYAQFPAHYTSTLVMSGFCGSCSPDWLINALVELLNGLHYVLRDWGLAIIGLVLIVRTVLHPITKRSQISMSRMTKLGPEMQRLKEKYGDDKEGLQKAQIQLTKEQGIAPILGCLPMLLQTPIWIALWSSLQSTFEIRHAPFLWGHTWIKDLAQPDRLVSLREPVGFWFINFQAINVLPILMGVIFWVQMKLQPQATAMTPEQEQQQKMMKWMMPFMMPIFLYSSPSGLNLYILTSTAIGIIESKIVRDHIKEREEKEKQGLVIVDDNGSLDPNKSGPGAKVMTPPKKGWLANLMDRAQQMAEEAQKNAKQQQSQIQKKKKK